MEELDEEDDHIDLDDCGVQASKPYASSNLSSGSGSASSARFIATIIHMYNSVLNFFQHDDQDPGGDEASNPDHPNNGEDGAHDNDTS